MDRKEQLRIFQSERIEVDASVNVDDYEDDVLSSHGELIGLVTGRKSPPGAAAGPARLKRVYVRRGSLCFWDKGHISYLRA